VTQDLDLQRHLLWYYCVQFVFLTQDLDLQRPGPGSDTQTEHNNTITSDVVNPGPGSGTQTEHNNIMTSDVVNPGPGSGTQTELVMVLLCSVCVPDPSQDLDIQRHLSWYYCVQFVCLIQEYHDK
jgi:hypothetical protein